MQAWQAARTRVDNEVADEDEDWSSSEGGASSGRKVSSRSSSMDFKGSMSASRRTMRS